MPRVLWRMSLQVMGVAGCLSLAPSAAWAQPQEDPLAAARALFGEALHAEETGDFAEALEKFERVRAVRDTASIEYRIGTCYEGLGDLVRAFRAHSAAVALGARDPDADEVSRAASGRLEALGKRIARLTLTIPSSRLGDADVTIDGVTVAPAAPIPLVPGRHVVLALAPGASPFRSEIALAEGAEVSLSVVLEPPPAAPPASPVTRIAPQSTEAPSPSSAPWFAIGGGGTLVVASAILLVVRHDEIARLDRACPGGTCPAGSNESDLESTRDRALVEGPVAAACGVAGVALAAAGIYWFAAGHGTNGARSALGVAPLISRGEMGIRLSAVLP